MTNKPNELEDLSEQLEDFASSLPRQRDGQGLQHGRSHVDAVMDKYGIQNLTDEEWEARDNAVRATSLEEARRNAAKNLKARVKKAIACGAPAGLVELVAHGDLDRNTAVMAELDSWRKSDRRIVVLSGPVGVGKTVSAVRWLMNHGGLSPCFTRAGDFEARGRYSHVWRSEWQNASGMILDDMGAEYKDSKGNLLADLDTLIDTFSVGAGKLVITTNLSWDDFQARYEERISSRIVGSAKWVNVAGQDLRRL